MASRETDEKLKGGRRTKGRMLAGAELRSAAQNSARSSRMRRLNGHDCFSEGDLDYQHDRSLIYSSYGTKSTYVPAKRMFLSRSLALPEDHVATEEAEASVSTASVSSASVEIRLWRRHVLEYVSVCSTFTCGTLDLLQRSGSEIRSAFFSRAASSRERAVISHPSGTC